MTGTGEEEKESLVQQRWGLSKTPPPRPSSLIPSEASESQDTHGLERQAETDQQGLKVYPTMHEVSASENGIRRQVACGALRVQRALLLYFFKRWRDLAPRPATSKKVDTTSDG